MMDVKKKKKIRVDRSKENFNTNGSIDKQDPGGSYTGKSDPAISYNPVQDADDL
ncbi:MAG: hypothetical protein IJO93_02430 [Clostridia bacterium]|nr:hypothetical protein [Clostridia bacterium]